MSANNRWRFVSISLPKQKYKIRSLLKMFVLFVVIVLFVIIFIATLKNNIAVRCKINI